MGTSREAGARATSIRLRAALLRHSIGDSRCTRRFHLRRQSLGAGKQERIPEPARPFPELPSLKIRNTDKLPYFPRTLLNSAAGPLQRGITLPYTVK